MRQKPQPFVRFLAAGVLVLGAAIFAGAQTNVIPARITQAVDPANRTILRGNTHPLAQAQFDRGAAPASLPMQRMLLVLKRSAQQETALDSLLEQQQDATSPNFHHWLAPQQFGQQFGPSDQDIQTIISWLQSQGFQVDRVSNGRTVIEFSGTAGEVQSAFHTTIHQYLVNGENHWANSSDPSIPAALAPVVAGIDTLYNFPRHAMHHAARTFLEPRQGGASIAPTPNYTLKCGTNPQTGQSILCFGLGPYDFATIYNVLPEWNASPAINGTGETIAIVGESDVQNSDIEAFQNFFGLTPKDPTVIVDGADPGIVPGDETESDLDIEVAGGVAPGATIDFVISKSTEASLGVDLSAQYIVDNNLASVLSESYGICEFFMGTAGNQFYNQLWQQAAAQGITVVVASGDSGSAVCDGNLGSQGPATDGLSVSGFESTPYNVSVGGTDFNDLNNPNTYWKSTNSTKNESAIGYIPEMTWNNTCTNQEIFSFLGTTSAAQTCNSSNVGQNYPFLLDPVGGSGGKSGCTTSDFNTSTGSGMLSSCSGGYAKPSWQTALTPADSNRDVPDVAMFASNGFNGSFYLICEADAPAQASFGPCGASQLVGLGGTSAPTPAFAGIMALVNQKTQSRWGNANYILYKLAATAANKCSSASPTSGCIFYDIPSGSTIAMPCVPNSTADCNTTGGDSVGVLSGYATASGYDLATGLGSVNVANLVNGWHAISLSGSSTTLTLNSGNPVNITHGTSVAFTTSVSAVAPATGTPTGTVALVANTGTSSSDGVSNVTLDSSGNGSGSTNALPGGTYNVVANYPGDGTFGSSTSPGTSVTVNPEPSKVQIAYELFNPNTGAQTNPNATSAVFGTPALLRVNVTSAAGDACASNSPGSNGCPTGSVALTDSYNGAAATPLDSGTYNLNSLGYAEDLAVDLIGGTHAISAAYAGDASYTAPASPGTDTLTITPAQASLSVTGSTFSPVVGANVTFVANLFAFGVYSSHGPNGSVTFSANGTQIGNPVPISGSASATTGSAFATAATNWTAAGHGSTTISATYDGDPSYTASPANFSIDVMYGSSTTVGSPMPASIQYGGSVTLNAQVSPGQGGAGTPFTGTINFYSNNLLLGSPNVSASGAASLTTTALQGGTDTITAQYNGDNNFAYSSSLNHATVTVTKASTTTAITTPSSSVTQGSNVTLAATVTPASQGAQSPSGNLQFFANGTSIGTAPVASNDQAQVSTSTLPAGPDAITATYSGDGNYAGSSASSGPTITVTTFSVSGNPSTINVSAPGQSGSTTLTFTSQYGFSSNGSATLSPSCTGLPAESSCSISPSSITLAANGTATATLTIMTTAASGVIPSAPSRWNIGGWQWPHREAAGIGVILVMLCFASALGWLGRRRRWGLAFALVALMLVFAGAGCGGSGSGGGGGGGNPGTPPGSKAISVSFTINGVTQTVPNLSVSVQ